jgi:hypothetical protein
LWKIELDGIGKNMEMEWENVILGCGVRLSGVTHGAVVRLVVRMMVHCRLKIGSLAEALEGLAIIGGGMFSESTDELPLGPTQRTFLQLWTVQNDNGGDLGRRYCPLTLSIVNDEIEPGKIAYTSLNGVPRVVCQEDRTPEMKLKMLATRQPSDTSSAKSADNPPMVMDKTKGAFGTPTTSVHPAQVYTLTQISMVRGIPGLW